MFDLIGDIWAGVAAFIDTHGILAIAIVLCVEELGIPSPIPGDLLMLLAGVRVTQGHATLVEVLLIETTATYVGTTILYFVARRGGRPVVMRYGRFIGVTPERLATVERKIAGREMAAVFVGRLIPGLRSLTVLTAGVVGIPPRQFFPAVFAGSFLYLAFYTVLGVLVGPPMLHFMEQLAFPGTVLWSVAGLLALVLSMRELRHTDPSRFVFPSWLATYFLGGLIAGIAALLAANIVSGSIETFVRASGRPVADDLVRGLRELHFLLGWPVFLIVTAAVGAAYRRLGLRSRPLVLRVLFTIALPLAASMLVSVGPLLGLDEARDRTLTYWLIVSAAATRWVVFGAVLEMLPLIGRTRVPIEVVSQEAAIE